MFSSQAEERLRVEGAVAVGGVAVDAHGIILLRGGGGSQFGFAGATVILSHRLDIRT